MLEVKGLCKYFGGIRAVDDCSFTAEDGRITALMPFRGQDAACSEAWHKAHGRGFPGPGEVTASGAARCVWTGRGQAFLMGPAPDAALGAHGAVTDQSDAWAMVLIEGAAVTDILARLVPIDLRTASFPVGHTARTLLQHMTVSITRVSASGFQIMAFRSMAATLVHEIETAMALVAARGAG